MNGMEGLRQFINHPLDINLTFTIGFLLFLFFTAVVVLRYLQSAGEAQKMQSAKDAFSKPFLILLLIILFWLGFQLVNKFYGIDLTNVSLWKKYLLP